jgi:hypothetical protein
MITQVFLRFGILNLKVMKVSELKKALESADDNADVEVYDADGNQWEIYNTQNLVDEKLFRINLY